ncbi:UDP-N-acetylmuramoyl-tripeptide--D-alanyl-D-alanine ligase [Thermoflexibacter ruber]|uniref:UDP-N-acetylmuramoyl-tripeptide--D-alanyl-D-alanine ligase n=1 Tax=Thermoflexibacter ruber TaxID=1003 RepID=A0A1I2IR21_9BACT|nr:UDP-N-acetylmuramoyl-tripeptide--D-alanyl-D-alanine ligase [Thermoflexibacter ruber]SFF44765.1 UDP-N-acetylmuramoyl-tripeptide--D-alanyl-D-alanine ligase [Thermoflexibacter ruber]
MLTTPELYAYFRQCSGICTDTRKIKEDCLFVALKGSNFNANYFAQQALDKGAKYAVIDEADFNTSERFLLVRDSLKALQDLANFHRNTLPIPFIGITGTNGKTTTKELVNAVLSTKFTTKATQGNLNNHIGVPLTLLEITEKDEIAVIEMGANHVGDIQELCAIAEPNFGLITNIGQAHLEGFGSFEGVLRAKSELYDHLLKRGGTAFINAHNPILHNMGKRFERSGQAKVIYYGTPESFYYAEILSASPYIIYKNESGKTIETQLLGAYNFDNILTALCVGKYFGVEMQAAHQAVANYIPTNNRSQVIKGDRNTLILDAYNANPSSMKAALENFAQMPAQNKVVILGDMFELGSFSEDKHKEIIDLVADMNFPKAFFCGKEFHKVGISLAKNFPQLYFFENKDDLQKYLQENQLKNSYLLVKGSRGMGLESLLESIK